MKKNTIEYGKDLSGPDIWTDWLEAMRERLATCMPESVLKISARDERFSTESR